MCDCVCMFRAVAGRIAQDHHSEEHTSIVGYSVRSMAMVAEIVNAQADGVGIMNDREQCMDIAEVLFGVWVPTGSNLARTSASSAAG